MNYRLENGKIVRQFFEGNNDCLYDVSNKKISAQFNGNGTIVKYSASNRFEYLVENSMYLNISVNGEIIEENIIVEMIAKEYTIKTRINNVNLEINYCIDESSFGVALNIVADIECDLVVNFGFILNKDSYIKYLVNLGQSINLSDSISEIEDGYLLKLDSNYEFYVKSRNIFLREHLDQGYHFTLRGSRELNVNFSCVDENTDVVSNSKNYTNYLSSLIETTDEFEKYYFITTLNTCLSMYKDVDDFKGFFAGINYQYPARTYYRDSYYTVLPLLLFKPELVLTQIESLYLGVKNGVCPSAVNSDGSDWWSDHYDSGLFLIKLVYDYVCFTNNTSIIRFEVLESIINYLITKSDDTSLIVKARDNRRDWCDNIYRQGYSSYLNILYYDAVSKYNLMANKFGYKSSFIELESVLKTNINKILLNEDNYYNNYVGENVEDNLSIDTVFASINGLHEKPQDFLKVVENMLETRNNNLQVYDDWGVMCVYPFYKFKSDLVEKSSYDYNYHNGSDWPYLSSFYAYTRYLNGLDFKYPLYRSVKYSLDMGWNTLVEYYNPRYGRGSFLQGWSGFGLMPFVFDKCGITYDLDGVLIKNKSYKNLIKLGEIYENRI